MNLILINLNKKTSIKMFSIPFFFLILLSQFSFATPSLEIKIDSFQTDNPETLNKESSGFDLFAKEMAKSIAVKMGKEASQEYNFAMVAIFQNEASFIKEWIEFHKIVGVEHFYLFNNLSTDHYLEVLTPYLLSGEVTLIEWPYHTNEEKKNWPAIQRASYLTTIKLVSKKVKWLAIVDIDEYIVPVKEDNLPSILSSYENFGGVCINWQMYGTSFVKKIPENTLLTETLFMKAKTDFAENLHVKSIVRPERVLMARTHNCTYLPGYFAVDTNKEILQEPLSAKVHTDVMKIHHYWSKDEDFFLRTKISRREKWLEDRENMFERVNNCNQEQDQTMLRFTPMLRKKMGLK